MLRADLQRPGSAEWRLGWASLLSAWLLARVDGAVPAAIPIDKTTLEALRDGEDVCGTTGHRLACLRVTPCPDVDGAVPCSASDAVWLPSDGQEAKGRAMLWRKLLPLPAGPHPNEDALKASGKRLLCGTAAFFKLPRAVVLYEKPPSSAQRTRPHTCAAASHPGRLLPHRMGRPPTTTGRTRLGCARGGRARRRRGCSGTTQRRIAGRRCSAARSFWREPAGTAPQAARATR